MLEGIALILNTGVFFQLIYQMKLHTYLFLICDVDSTFNLTVTFSMKTVLKKILKVNSTLQCCIRFYCGFFTS